MKQVLLFVVVTCLGCEASVLAQPQKPLTDADIVEMVKAGFQESFIIKLIEERSTDFDTSTEALLTLKKWNVSEKILEAMLAAERRKASGRQPVPRPPALPRETVADKPQRPPKPSAVADSVVRAGSGEVAVFGGINGNLMSGARLETWNLVTGTVAVQARQEGKKTHPMGGIEICVAPLSHMLVTGEFTYNPMGSFSLSWPMPLGLGTVRGRVTETFYTYGGGLKLVIPTAIRRAAPYFAAVLGGVTVRDETSISGGPWSPTSGAETWTRLAGNVGGGIRLHFSNNVGMNVDVRGARLPGITYFRTTLGVFLRLGGE